MRHPFGLSNPAHPVITHEPIMPTKSAPKVPTPRVPVNAKSQATQITHAAAPCYTGRTMRTTSRPQAKITVTTLGSVASPEQAAVIFGKCTDCCILESSQHDSTYARFSIFAVDPVETINIPFSPKHDALHALIRRVRETQKHPSDTCRLPFAGGWIGCLSYESGLSTERISPTAVWPADFPAIRMGLFDCAAVYDHDRSEWFAVAADLSHLGHEPRIAACIQKLTKMFDAAAGLREVVTTAAPTCEPIAQITPEDYLRRARRAQQYIEAGDIYQVNLTQRWTVTTQEDPLDTYLRLRRESPSPHAAFLRFDHHAVISASPELFLRFEGGTVVTRPIKGTRPRVGRSDSDQVALSELTSSEKDRAELNMIVDLLRNDLGRVCRFGSVRVTDADMIETHPTVYHRVATITGQLADGKTWHELLRATFPGGSITGAPKIRAMQIIAELEDVARTAYCGAIGWIGLDGAMSWNVAIRTIVQSGTVAHVHAGGAIVADSVPENEYDETLTKGTAMFRALGCPPPTRMSDKTEEPVLT